MEPHIWPKKIELISQDGELNQLKLSKVSAIDYGNIIST